MDIVSILLIAVGLSVDSFAVSATDGLCFSRLSLRKKLWIATVFAVFQAGMPVLGWLIGRGIEDEIKAIDHWIAFVLLVAVGAKAIYEALTSKTENTDPKLGFRTIVLQAIATSIDAFVVGIGFALLSQNIAFPVLMIGLVTFIFSFVGLQLGTVLGYKAGSRIEIFGGIVLIGIGFKILIEHLYF